MYAECSKRVADKRMQDPRKDTTVILNELLADEVWLSQVRTFLDDLSFLMIILCYVVSCN